MIINHEYKFIFLKTRKTAGTSLEIALSQFCGPADVITSIDGPDEAIRAELGFRGSQNTAVKLSRYRPEDWRRLLTRGRRRHFRAHVPARVVEHFVDPPVWHDYFKFTIERNPFDKAVSRYFWSTRKLGTRPPVSEFIPTLPDRLLSDWSVYTLDDKPVVDRFVLYETLQDDLKSLEAELGLPGPLELPRTKASHRKKRNHYSEIIDADTRRHIESVCAREMKLLGYSWEQK